VHSHFLKGEYGFSLFCLPRAASNPLLFLLFSLLCFSCIELLHDSFQPFGDFLLLAIVDFALNNWYEYCFWKFG